MAVNWDWNYKKGEITLKRKGNFKINIYCGNCSGALIYDFKDENGKEMYQFYGFWNDLKHLKNCLGLSGAHKGDNIYKDEFKKVKLNVYYSECLKMAELFTQAGIKVELYYKKMKNPRCN